MTVDKSLKYALERAESQGKAVRVKDGYALINLTAKLIDFKIDEDKRIFIPPLIPYGYHFNRELSKMEDISGLPVYKVLLDQDELLGICELCDQLFGKDKYFLIVDYCGLHVNFPEFVAIEPEYYDHKKGYVGASKFIRLH